MKKTLGFVLMMAGILLAVSVRDQGFSGWPELVLSAILVISGVKVGDGL